jgi:hypothetical protein
MNAVLSSAAILVLGSALAAQAAAFQTFGRGCRGTAYTWCAGNNVNATQMPPFVLIAYPQYAVEVEAGGPVVIQSFEFLTRNASGQVTVPAFIFLPDATTGVPQLTPLATGSIVVGTTVGWYTATFAQPVVVTGGRFFLSWQQNATSKAFMDPFANGGVQSRSWSRPNNAGAWSGPANNLWAFRVNCIGIKGMPPRLSNTGLPKIGTSYAVALSGALATAPSLLITGLSNQTWGPFPLPLDLGAAGAGGCSLLVSYDFVLGAAADNSGNASLSIALPNDSRLVGLKLHHQWATVDAPANRLGLAFSNGGTATLGN